MAKAIEIIARKRSQDPVQEALREHKSTWNEKVKLLIAQLIAFKRGINGRGDPRAGLPPSNIKYPFPPEIPQYLEEMSQRYLDVINDAKSIVGEQESYSQKRNKGKEVIQASEENEIEKFASWWGSRLWTWISQYPIIGGDVAIKERIALLNVTTAVIQYLDEIDRAIIGSTPEAVYKFLSMKDFFNIRFMRLFSKLIERYKTEAEEGNIPVVEPKKEEVEAPATSEGKNILYDKLKEELEDILFISPSLNLLYKINKGNPIIQKLNEEYKLLDKVGKKALSLMTAKDQKYHNQYNLFLSKYNDTLSLISKEFDIEVKSFKDFNDKVEELYKKTIASYEPELQKLAQKSLKRWLRRMRLGLFSSEEDRMKLDVVIKIHEIIKSLDRLQDSLEEESPLMASIVDEVSGTVEKLSKISEQMYQLAEFHNSQEELKKLKKEKYTPVLIKREHINKLKSLVDYYDKIKQEISPAENG